MTEMEKDIYSLMMVYNKELSDNMVSGMLEAQCDHKSIIFVKSYISGVIDGLKLKMQEISNEQL